MFPRDTPESPDEPERPPEGAAAQAIRDAELSLARQNSVAAQVDLQVITAVLNAHAARADGAATLEALQREVEAAVQTRTDLDTPAGARSFQHYLIDKMRDIRDVVESAELDATSRAGLAAAMASLYASAGQAAADTVPRADPATAPGAAPAAAAQAPAAEATRPEPEVPAGPLWELPPLGDELALPPMEASAEPPPPAPVAAPVAPPASMPGWGGGVPAGGMPLGGAGLPPLSIPPLPGFGADPAAARVGDTADDPADPERPEPDPAQIEEPPAEDPAGVEEAGSRAGLRPGDPDPEVAQVISAAVSGTPIPDAFGERGIDIPAPGTLVGDPVDPVDVVAGDVGVLTDRHALALGNGKALLDDQIQPIASVNRPGFIGWHHPPAGSPETSTPPESPAPTRPAETAE